MKEASWFTRKYLALTVGLIHIAACPSMISPSFSSPISWGARSGENRVEEALIWLDAQLNIPYIWGGTGDPGYDCSGLVVEWLQTVGEVTEGYDNSAQGLYNKYVNNGRHSAHADPAMRGALAFYGKSVSKITHVAIVRNEYLIIEAGGGGSKITDVEAAQKAAARVRMRPIKARKDFLVMIKPHYTKLGRFF
jgi:cell wall-associated NlpC family hydrolase